MKETQKMNSSDDSPDDLNFLEESPEKKGCSHLRIEHIRARLLPKGPLSEWHEIKAGAYLHDVSFLLGYADKTREALLLFLQDFECSFLDPKLTSVVWEKAHLEKYRDLFVECLEHGKDYSAKYYRR